MNSTIFQLIRLVRMFKGLKSDRMKHLIASDLLTDLRRATAGENLGKVNRHQYQKILGIPPTVFPVKMGGPETTDEIVSFLEANGFTIDRPVNQANFPLKNGDAIGQDEIVIIDPSRSFTGKEGLKIIEKEGLSRPTYEHALRFAHQHAEVRRSGGRSNLCIVFPHEPWYTHGWAHVLCVKRKFCGNDGRVTLGLSDVGFDNSHVLAGVRPRCGCQNHLTGAG